MRILFFSNYYTPDGGPAAPLFGMLAENLVKNGHEVTVITTPPHYPTGYVNNTYRTWRISRSIENGVKVARVPIPSIDRKSLVNRLIQFLAYQVGATIEGYRSLPDVVISHSPSLEVWFPFLIHGINKKRKTIYSIHDVYPDVGIRMGIFRSKIIVKLITRMEKKFINEASIVRVLSKSFIKRVQELGAAHEKIRLIYDWVDINSISPMDRQNSFSMEYDLNNTFNIFYTGNIGKVQGLLTVIEAAKLLRNHSDIRFVFVGEGIAKQDLIRESNNLGLTNVVFIPYQPREKMGEVLASSDIGLVCLRKGTGFGALPSKTYSILASGRPLIACVDEGSDTWDVVQQSMGGVAIPPENPQLLAEAIIQIYADEDLRNSMGIKGRRYVVKFHSLEFGATQFEEIINHIYQ